MPFESLSFRYTLRLANIPHRWLPLIHLYDPDLPLFPIYYFHVLKPNLLAGARPLLTDRAFGYVEHVRLCSEGGIDVGLIVNKDLSLAENGVFLRAVESEIQERFGIANPVTQADVEAAFLIPLDQANPLLVELWHRVVANAYGNLLPFGRLWDGVLGLARFVASFNSMSGRKGELIQTHYFASRFGVPIPAAAGIPQLDFFLLPTIGEVLDATNPLTDFPRFVDLLRVAGLVAQHHGAPITVGGITLTRFRNPVPGAFNTAAFFGMIHGAHIPHNLGPAATECFNAFGKGPPRTILFLLMLSDLRDGLLRPGALTSAQCGSLYDGLRATYQSPKVIEIYAQQCFGNAHAMPVDVWVRTFLQWPLNVYPTGSSDTPFSDVFSHARGLGKVERLIWVTAQARKVHSSACDDAVWCIKYGSDQKPQKPRGANPLGCTICLDPVRTHCPAFAAIRNQTVGFNGAEPDADFQVTSSAGDNATPNQSFTSCRGKSIYTETVDSFSPADNPEGFAPFPSPIHGGEVLTVQEFVDIYGG
jgi:hypothetical protein